MEAAPSGGPGDAVAGLVVADGSGRYFAIAWAELARYHVPTDWLATVAAVVHGAEPMERGQGLRGHADARTLSAEHVLLLETLSGRGSLRPAVQRLEAWAVLR